MPVTDAPKRQHLSISGEWVACYASVKPCPRTQHRDSFPFERETFFAEIDAHVARQPQVRLSASAQDVAEIAAEVHLEALRLLDEQGNLEFANHSSDEYGEWLTLADMADGDKARNNCWAVTGELLEQVAQDEFGGEVVQQIEIEGSGVYHTALATYSDGQYFVIDYTMRQFDQSLPFPYVDTQENWIATVEKASGLAMRFSGEDYEDEDDGGEDDSEGWFAGGDHTSLRIGG